MSRGVLVIAVGNLGQAPDLRHTAGGTAVANLSIGCNYRTKVNGEWTEATEWVRAVCFGKTAENAGEYLTKGSKVYVEGRMQTRKWEDKEGQTRYTTEIVVDTIQFLDSKGGGGSAATEPSSDGPEDSIPF